MYEATMLDEGRKHKKQNMTGVLFCKFSLSKMASVKTNKNKNQTPLLKTNFVFRPGKIPSL